MNYTIASSVMYTFITACYEMSILVCDINQTILFQPKKKKKGMRKPYLYYYNMGICEDSHFLEIILRDIVFFFFYEI